VALCKDPSSAVACDLPHNLEDLFFASIDALQLRLQASHLGHIPYEVFLALPFVFTILAMAVLRNATAPAALLLPFRKEER
jgi:simple sugar transport system permease protein